MGETYNCSSLLTALIEFLGHIVGSKNLGIAQEALSLVEETELRI